jgi:hypothetical protein
MKFCEPKTIRQRIESKLSSGEFSLQNLFVQKRCKELFIVKCR